MFPFHLNRMDFAIWTHLSWLQRSRATPTSHQGMQKPWNWRSIKTARRLSVSMLHIGHLFSTATASTMNPLVVSYIHSYTLHQQKSSCVYNHLLLVFSRQHHWWFGPRCACSGIRHPERGAVLVGKELMVHLLGQRRLHPHVYEG